MIPEPTAGASAAPDPSVASDRIALAELMTLGASLIVGVVVMPCVIFLVGRASLGPYAHGGVFAFWRDFIAGLGHGSEAFWFVAIAPYLLVWLVRGGRHLQRAMRR